MKLTQKLLVFVALCALLLVPTQAARAASPKDGPVIVGYNYVLKSGDSLESDLVVVGGSVTIEADARLGGDLVVVGGSATLAENANIEGEVVLVGGTLNLETTVASNVVVIGGPVNLGEKSHVKGDLISLGGVLERASGAKIDGQIIDNPRPASNMDPESSWFSFARVFEPLQPAAEGLGQSFVLGLLAAALAALLPEHMRRVASAINGQPVMAGGFGFLTLVAFIVSLVALGLFSVLVITLLLTVPTAALALLTFMIASTFGWIVLGTELGTRLVGSFRREWPLPATAALGTFLLTLLVALLKMIPVLGLLALVAEFVASLVGIGAVAMTRFGTRFYVPSATASVIPGSEPAST